jgi:LPXTG-site transpeptidase (sortase) family protein
VAELKGETFDRRWPRVRPPAVLAAAGLVCALVAGVTAVTDSPRRLPAADWIWPPPPQLWADRNIEPPTRLRIPRINVDSPLETLDLDPSGAMTLPSDYQIAGWYQRGAAPGDPGAAVIAGHVDSRTGAAVFFRLGELRAGDTIEVDRGGRRVMFRVTSTGRYPKSQIPTDLVYAPTPVPTLRLITCGGTFDYDRDTYLDNVVVFAALVT